MMNKKTSLRRLLCGLFAACLLACLATLPVGAAAPLLLDEYGLFDADTAADLEQQAEEASARHNCNVYLLVVSDTGSESVRSYAKNYYMINGLGNGAEQSGILFLVAVDSREYVTITYGGGVTAFTDYRIEQIERAVVDKLSDDDWEGAAEKYLSMSADTLDYYAENGEPIDVDNDSDSAGWLFVILPPCVIAAIVCAVLASRMKTARLKTEADDYTPGLVLNVQRDLYINTTRTQVYDPPHKDDDNNSSGGGSSVDSSGFGGSSGGSF